MGRRPAIIAYDISSNKTRRQVRRTLLEWRVDGQLSVHECLLHTDEAEELFLQLCEAIDPQRDRLLLAWVTPRRPVLARGVGRSASLFQRLDPIT